MNLENFPQKPQFISLRVIENIIRLGLNIPDSRVGWSLFYSGSKVCWGWVGSGPISRSWKTPKSQFLNKISIIGLVTFLPRVQAIFMQKN